MPRPKSNKKRKRDVAASSAALLFNLLPELAKLPSPACYRRLAAFLEATINAYEDEPEPEFCVPEPSDN